MIEGNQITAASRRKLDYLQVARGIAALLVCFFHARYFLNGSKNYGDFLFHRGDIGVPIFFVISGFIIAYTTQNVLGLSKIKNYFVKRYLRIAPLYFLCSVIYVFVEGKAATYINGKFGEVVRAVLFLPATEPYPPLHVGWTLVFEMFFYVFFGLCLFFGKRKFVVFFTGVFLMVIVFPLANGIPLFSGEWYRFQPIHNYLNVISSPLVLQFAFGVALFLIIPKLNVSVKYILLINVITITGLVAYYFLLPKTDLPDMLFCGSFVAGILLLDFSKTSNNVPRFFTYLGDISFSLYLTHAIILLLWIQISGKFTTLSNLPGLLKFVISIVLMLVFAVLTYEFVEKKITNLLKPLTTEKQPG